MKVVLLSTVWVDGVEKHEGDTVDVDQQTAEWLEAQKCAVLPKAKPKSQDNEEKA